MHENPQSNHDVQIFNTSLRAFGEKWNLQINLLIVASIPAKGSSCYGLEVWVVCGGLKWTEIYIKISMRKKKVNSPVEREENDVWLPKEARDQKSNGLYDSWIATSASSQCRPLWIHRGESILAAPPVLPSYSILPADCTSLSAIKAEPCSVAVISDDQ